jgi:hypothetical protein
MRATPPICTPESDTGSGLLELDAVAERVAGVEPADAVALPAQARWLSGAGPVAFPGDAR